MADNFRACDRDQAFLLPPDLRDWLPSGHLAWFVPDVLATGTAGRRSRVVSPGGARD
jgi:hypothetical protein